MTSAIDTKQHFLQSTTTMNHKTSNHHYSEMNGVPISTTDLMTDRMNTFEICDESVRATSSMQVEDDQNNSDVRMEEEQRRQVEISPSSPPPPPPPHQHSPVVTTTGDHPISILDTTSPAAAPIRLPMPYFHQGERADVLVDDPATGKQIKAKNVLFRENSDEGQIIRAYWRVEEKPKVETRMGHIEFCVVLEPCVDDDDSDDEDEEDIVFQITDEIVAIKVNYMERVKRLRDKFAEDPLGEIAAMQLLSNSFTFSESEDEDGDIIRKIVPIESAETDSSQVEGHPNVMTCQDVLYDGECLSVVMPYCNGGDLFERVDPHERGLEEEEARKWFVQFISGLQHLQRHGICHRDLSPENLILSADPDDDDDDSDDDDEDDDEESQKEEARCLVIDLGMCLWVPHSNPLDQGETVVPLRANNQPSQTPPPPPIRRLIKPQGQCGKWPYMSPEVYKNRAAFDGYAIDCWTSGVILFFMVTGYSYRQPYDDVFRYMVSDLQGLLTYWGFRFSDELIDLLQGLIREDPSERLTLEQVLAHPWLAM